jgi:O-antigen ligase
MADIVGTLGMLMLLGAFLANALGRLRPTGVPYQALNAVGAGILAWYSLRREVYIFAILEGAWCVAALVNLLRTAAAGGDAPEAEGHEAGGRR